MNQTKILAPVKGKVIPLEQVPDEVFAEKVLGDGVAIIPEDGKIYSPVDGTITTITDSLHAYGFETEDGIQMIVHFGLETVNLKGKGFTSNVKVGDKVKAGDLVAEVDLAYLREQHVETITPVIVCGGIEYDDLMFQYGETEAKEVLMRTKEPQKKMEIPEASAIETSVQENADVKKETKKKDAAKTPKEKKKFPINFDFLQKLGKVLMTVIAVMPAAGLMISIGNLIVIVGGDITAVNTFGTTVAEIGWGIINNLHILFAAAIGGSWAKERAGGAFAAVIAFCLINVITGAVLGVSSDMLADPNAVTHTLFGQEILVADYFVDILGKPALNMGVFVGIISGFVGANAYNKYYNFRKLPDALSFFNGKRFVPLVVIFYSAITAVVLSVIWPVVQTGINNFGIWIANSSDTSPILAPFVYGTLERLLLPFGLHHMLTIPMNYTSFGGTYTILTGANVGTQVFGQDPLWLAWATDLINLKDAGDMAAYQNLLRDGGKFNSITVTSADGSVNIKDWEPATGSIITLGKEFDERQVIHFLNFINANSTSWRDLDGSMPEPSVVGNFTVTIQLPSGKNVGSAWIASPDTDYGASRALAFSQNGTELSITIPSLKYWSMLVLEYE